MFFKNITVWLISSELRSHQSKQQIDIDLRLLLAWNYWISWRFPKMKYTNYSILQHILVPFPTHQTLYLVQGNLLHYRFF